MGERAKIVALFLLCVVAKIVKLYAMESGGKPRIDPARVLSFNFPQVNLPSLHSFACCSFVVFLQFNPGNIIKRERIGGGTSSRTN